MACTYVIKDSAGNEISFDTREEALRYAKENNLAESPIKGDPVHTTETLANVLRQMSFGENNYNPQQLRVFQEELLDEFIRLEEQSQFFYKMGSAIALTKGLGKNFDQMNNVKKNLADLGIGKPSGEELTAPFDVRYLLTGDSQYKPANSEPYYHKITAGNIKKMNEIIALSKTIFMEQTPTFTNTSDKVVANLKSSVANSTEKVREIADDLNAYYQIAAYKRWVEIQDKRTSTLRNSLIYDSQSTSKATETIVDIVKDAVNLAPDNAFLKFVLPVTTIVKIGKKKARNVNNKDLINTIEGKTRGKIEPDLIATLMDSFTELYQNPRTQYHAKALFDYLIVKDGLMFKNKSFIKMIPTMMFENISNAADVATELLSLSTMAQYSRFLRKLDAIPVVDREGNERTYFTAAEKQEFNDLFRANNPTGVRNKLFNKVFGLNPNQLYNRFETIYATDQKYQYNLDLIKTKVKTKTGIRTADGIAFGEENGKTYMHVNMFPKKFTDTVAGSEERKAVFADLMDQFAQVGFGKMEVDEGKNELQFKKFVRIKQEKPQAGFLLGVEESSSRAEYKTYQLIQVQRKVGDRVQTFTGEAMTVEGELIPRGTYAVYGPVDTVGTSNSTGVADLGVRPTKEQVLATLEDKLRRDDDQTPPSAPPSTPTGPVIPTTPGTPVSGGTYMGPITSLADNQVFVFGSNPVGINGNPQAGTGGAALVALKNKWVEQGERMDNLLSKSGKAWGLTTVTYPGRKRSKSAEEIKQGIKILYNYASATPNKQFLVAYMGKTGTNLNGYSNKELADMFSSIPIPSNIIFEREFNTLINRGGGLSQQTLFPTQPVTPTSTNPEQAKDLRNAANKYMEDYLKDDPKYYWPVPKELWGKLNVHEEGKYFDVKGTRITMKNLQDALAQDKALGDQIGNNADINKSNITGVTDPYDDYIIIPISPSQDIEYSSFSKLLEAYSKEKDSEIAGAVEKFMRKYGLEKYIGSSTKSTQGNLFSQGDSKTIQGGMFAGLKMEAFDPNSMSTDDFFISDEDIKKNLDNLDGCNK